jgi:hypothetical protein
LTKTKAKPAEPPRPIDQPFVFVLWLDAVIHDDWEFETSLERPSEVWSTGFLVIKNRSHITLASDVGIEDGHNRRITIPLGMVVRIHRDNMTGPLIYSKRRTAATPKVADAPAGK